ncbi:hypothetical protein [Mediterraneibacter glycyrrhizinilyticus]|uniref:hypothetical protein n=1 Tax=Mediterraneibacter glycyrrhizinilyticus TaxID=342942 RepID=UPI0025A422B5|nr:hypothetical protein [Mediterraneibacter glycyrrhizinilyticus]MDM8209635.1 hypothetical protein [Mediterraneibacter glycyrrhizinilyticus]
MNYDKDEYEQLIDSSLLFTLDREKEYIVYRREVLKMVEYLYCYLMAINVHKYETFGVEIVDTAKRCIESYKPDSGRFLNYFSSAWKQTYGHLIGRELVREKFKGIHFTEYEERNFRKYMRLAQNMGVDTESSEFDDRVAEAMGISTSDVDNLRSMINCRPIYGSRVNEEGEEYSLIDQLDSGKYTDIGVLQFEAVKEFMDIIELAFNQLQERQKPLLAMLITSKIAFLALEDERIRAILKRKAFFDEGIFEETMSRGEQIQAKEIADRFGVVEASASRSWRRFKNGLKTPCHYNEW